MVRRDLPVRQGARGRMTGRTWSMRVVKQEPKPSTCHRGAIEAGRAGLRTGKILMFFAIQRRFNRVAAGTVGPDLSKPAYSFSTASVAIRNLFFYRATTPKKPPFPSFFIFNNATTRENII